MLNPGKRFDKERYKFIALGVVLMVLAACSAGVMLLAWVFGLNNQWPAISGTFSAIGGVASLIWGLVSVKVTSYRTLEPANEVPERTSCRAFDDDYAGRRRPQNPKED